MSKPDRVCDCGGIMKWRNHRDPLRPNYWKCKVCKMESTFSPKHNEHLTEADRQTWMKL